MTQELGVTSLKGMEKNRTLYTNENSHKNERWAILWFSAIKTSLVTLDGPREEAKFYFSS